MNFTNFPVIMTFTEDCGENIGGFFVEVGIVLNNYTVKIDDFCVHPRDLGLPDTSKCNYGEARYYAEQYIRNKKEEYNQLIKHDSIKRNSTDCQERASM